MGILYSSVQIFLFLLFISPLNSKYIDAKITFTESGDDTLQAISFFGNTANANLGYSVSNAGDVNGDGFSDIIIGSWGDNSNTGRAYIYYGGIFMNNIPDVILTGEAATNYFGGDVSGLGDVNGDGYSDVIVGAQGHNSFTGRSYIFFGGSTMNDVADVILSGEQLGNLFGISVSDAGDVNNDGYSDVIVGANSYSSNKGRAYIYFGGNAMNNVADVILTGENTESYFGNSVSNAGDVNGDGFFDVIVGANRFGTSKGKAYVYYGGSVMNNIADVIMAGENIHDEFGWAVSGTGDINGDGYSDVIVGARKYNLGTGRAYIYYGGVVMDNVEDIVMTGESDSEFGWSVSGSGDVNGDGYPDAIVGAQRFNLNTGRAYIYYGGNSMNNIADVVLTGESGNDLYGVAVSGAGDVNGNGFTDVVVGSHGFDSNIGKAVLYENFVAKPKLINPSNNSVDNPTTIFFTWRKLSSALSYKIQISTDSTFSNIFMLDSAIVDTFRIVNSFSKETKYYWRIGGKDSLGRISYSTIWNLKTISPLKVNLGIIPEGIYYPLFNQLSRKDTVTVYLRTSTSPYQIVDTSVSKIDSILFSGLFTFNLASSGSFYLVAKHFNSIETWSKSGGEVISADGNYYNYDFTNSSSQAFGNNLILKGTKYCIFSGDINQDDFVDISDLITVYNNAAIFASGNRLPSDLNGDSIVDLSDITICFNNTRNFVSVIRP